MIETIPGTRAIGQRLAQAELDFTALIEEHGFTRDEAESIFRTYRKHRVIRRDGLTRYVVKHGAFWELDVLRRALEMN